MELRRRRHRDRRDRQPCVRRRRQLHRATDGRRRSGSGRHLGRHVGDRGRSAISDVELHVLADQPGGADKVVFDASTSTDDARHDDRQPRVELRRQHADHQLPGRSHCVGTRIISHAYTSAGVFVVNLVITDSAGRTGAHSTSVTVGTGNPEPVITFSPTDRHRRRHCRSASVGGERGCSAAPRSQHYSWNFGDGGAVCRLRIRRTHSQRGANTYTVRLTVTDSQGRIGTVTVTRHCFVEDGRQPAD